MWGSGRPADALILSTAVHVRDHDAAGQRTIDADPPNKAARRSRVNGSWRVSPAVASSTSDDACADVAICLD